MTIRSKCFTVFTTVDQTDSNSTVELGLLVSAQILYLKLERLPSGLSGADLNAATESAVPTS